MTPGANGKSNSNGEPQKRLACNRCHTQKLRCPRDEAGGDCGRCLKAGATCTYSPPLPMGRPALENGDRRKRRREPVPTATESTRRSSPTSTPVPASNVAPRSTSSTNDSPNSEQLSNGHRRSRTDTAGLLSFADIVREWQSDSSLEQEREEIQRAGSSPTGPGLDMDGDDPMALDGDGNLASLFLDYPSAFANLPGTAEFNTNFSFGQTPESVFSKRLSPVDASHGIFQPGSIGLQSHSLEDLRRGTTNIQYPHVRSESRGPTERARSGSLQGFSFQLLRNRGRASKRGQQPSPSSTFNRPESLPPQSNSQPRRDSADTTSPGQSVISDPVEECIKQLSEFNLTLYRRSKHRQELAAACSDNWSSGRAALSLDTQTAGADETFQASQTFIEILHRLIRKCKACKAEAANSTGSSFNSPSANSRGQSSNSSPFTFRSPSLNSYSNSPQSPSDPAATLHYGRQTAPSIRSSGSSHHGQSQQVHKKLDTPTVFLVLTCYLRLLEEFFLLLGMIRIHLQRIIQNPEADGSEHTQNEPSLPGLCFGSFSLSGSSEMQIVLLVQGIVHLLDRAKKAICLITESKERDLSGAARDFDMGTGDMAANDSGSDESDFSGESPVGRGLDGEIRCIAELALLEVVNQQYHARVTVKSVKKLLQASSAF